MDQIKLGGLLSYVALGLSNVLTLVYTPFMLRMMGQSEFGLYSLVLSIVSYLSLLDFGFGVALIRYISLYNSRQESFKLPSLFGAFFSLYSLIGIICFILGVFLISSLDLIFDSSLTLVEFENAKIMIIILVIYLSLSFPLSIFGAIIIANEKFVFQKSLVLCKTILTPVLMIPLLIYGYKSVAMIVVVVAVGAILIIANVWFCFWKLKIKIHFKDFDFNVLREVFIFSVFVFMKIFFERIYWSSGQLILGLTLGTVSVAVFSLSLQLKGYYESFSQAISGLFLPKLTSMVSNNSSFDSISEIFVKVGRIQFHILGFVLCIYILIGEQFIVFWAGKDYISVYQISLFIMIPYTIPLIQSVGYSLVQAYNVQKPVVLIYLLMALLTIVFTLVFLDDFGSMGAAIALCLAILIAEVLLMNLFYWKKLKVNILQFWKEIFKISIIMSLILATSYYFKFIFPLDNMLSLIIFVIFFSIFYFPIIYFFAMSLNEKMFFISLFRAFKSKYL